ncbi:MAG: glycosyltransferase [Armatimonadota bacterium]
MVAPRILIVTCYFVPGATPNATHAVELSSYMVKAGADVRVLTLAEEDILAVSPEDPSLNRLLSPKVHVERVDAGVIRRRLRNAVNPKDMIQRAKTNPLVQLLIPDPYADCILPLLKRGLAITKHWQPSVIVSIAYPWTCHVVSGVLARIRKAKWVATYSDLWTHNPASALPRARWREWVDARLENWLLRSVCKIIVTTEATKSLYLKVFPFLDERIEVVRFGYNSFFDLDSVPESRDPIRAPADRRVWIVHTGRVYREARSPEPLLKALLKLRAEYSNLDARLVVWFVGEVDNETRDQIHQWKLSSIVQIVPWVPRNELQRWMEAADWLLLLGNRGGVQVPSKLYEYLGARKPILMLRETPDDEALQIVVNVDAGWIVDNNEQSIVQFFHSFFENTLPHPTYQGAVPVEAFSSEAGLERYWRIVQQIV